MSLANHDVGPKLAPLRGPVFSKVLGAAAIFAVVIAGWQLQRQGILAHPEALAETANRHPYSAVGLFLLIYAATAAAGIPTLPLNLAAGWLWGPLAGGALSAMGTGCGATIAFGAARLLFGQPLRRRFDNQFLAWAQDEFESKGWRFVAFVRLNPVFPTGPLNYLFGLTSIPARTYIWATVVFLAPPSVAVAWIGSAVSRLRVGADAGQIMRIAMIISAAVTLMVGIRYGARYLNYSKSKRSS